MQFVYGPFSPDAQETATGILTVADGVLPLVEGYGPSPALTPTMSATALPGEPRGIISMFQRNGTNVVYGFTSTAFYQLNATYGWDLIASGLSLPASDDWSLAQFGNKLLASNTDYGMFEYDIELGGAIGLFLKLVRRVKSSSALTMSFASIARMMQGTGITVSSEPASLAIIGTTPDLALTISS